MAVGDGCFQLGDALGDPAAQRGGDVVVFEVEQLAGQAPFEVGDLGFEPLGSARRPGQSSPTRRLSPGSAASSPLGRGRTARIGADDGLTFEEIVQVGRNHGIFTPRQRLDKI